MYCAFGRKLLEAKTMSVLDDVLREEHDRLIVMRDAMSGEIAELPRGYISRKRISGREYCYLQKRIGGKIVSSFIKRDDVPALEKQINRRRQLKASLREVDENLKKIRRVVK